MNVCEFPKCKYLSSIGYIGHDICCVHWEQICSADSKTEKRLLKKIGLTREKDGRVKSLKK